MSAVKMILFVRTKLILQGRKSEDLSGKCMYRGPDGTRCAAGWLIPDKRYNPSIEGKAIEGVIPALGLKLPVKLVGLLQRVHDTRKVEDWPSAFANLISARDLVCWVRDRLLKQGAKSELGAHCLYRSGKMHCAGGWLIPKELYRVQMEQKEWPDLVQLYPKLSFGKHDSLIKHMQYIHDNCKVCDWADEFKMLLEEVS